MQLFRYFISLSVVILIPLSLHAQQDSTAAELESQLEKAFEEIDPEDSELDNEQLSQFLEDLAANPINLNQAGLDNLLQIPGINLKIARAILDYRKTKPFENKQELLKVKGVGAATYKRMSPYVSIGGMGSQLRQVYMRPEYWLNGRSFDYITRYQSDLQTKKGNSISPEEGGYLGSPFKYYQRLRMKSKHMSLNLTQEKDAGEAMDGFTDFDYTSGHIALTENGKLRDLVIGDYSLSFGQGLVLWTGGSFGKGREVTGTISKNERGVKAYSSAQETDFFRGFAATYGEKVQWTAFYSSRPRTASVVSGDTTRFPSSSGFHRTLNEIARKNNIKQTVAGGRLRADTPYGLIGLSGYHNMFSSYIAKRSSVSNLYDFEGNEHSVAGIDYRGLFGSSFIFGEYARSINGGYAGIFGVETAIGDDTELSLSYRNYAANFQNFMGSGFGESSSSPQNQEGFYIGLRHQLNRNFILSGYFDQYRFPAPRFGTTQATDGFDVLGLIEAKINSQLNLYLLLRNEVKDAEYVITNGKAVEQLLMGSDNRASVRVNLEYQMNTSVRLRSRIEFVRSQNAGEEWENGFLIYQDLRLSMKNKLRIDMRATLFDTESFNTRIYQFESDLLYVMSNTMLSDRGQRLYAVIKYNATDFLDIWLKYGVTVYEDVHVLSSGLNEVQGNRRSSLGIQARMQF